VAPRASLVLSQGAAFSRAETSPHQKKNEERGATAPQPCSLPGPPASGVCSLGWLAPLFTPRKPAKRATYASPSRKTGDNRAVTHLSPHQRA
jgi:hypothetical protein